MGPDGEETRAQTVQKSPEFLSTPESPSLLQDLQPSDSTSFILLNLTRAGKFLSFSELYLSGISQNIIFGVWLLCSTLCLYCSFMFFYVVLAHSSS